MATLETPVDVQKPERRDDDVAAWTMRRGAGAIHWRDAGLESDPLIAPWAIQALSGERLYADLTYRDLRTLRIASN